MATFTSNNVVTGQVFTSTSSACVSIPATGAALQTSDIWAIILSAGPPYAWREVVYAGGGKFAIKPDGRDGLAYEYNGNAEVPTGKIVLITKTNNFYNFLYCCKATQNQSLL